MSVRYDESVPGPNTDFSDIRDSFYILMNMNQYSMGYMAAFKKESEGLLRVALFSKALSLIDTTQSLREVRHELAEQMRSSRKKGAVPVFISTMWFLFSLCISIQQGTWVFAIPTSSDQLIIRMQMEADLPLPLSLW